MDWRIDDSWKLHQVLRVGMYQEGEGEDASREEGDH